MGEPDQEHAGSDSGQKPLIADGRVAYGLAFLSGFLYFVAFPGIDVWPLAFVALVPLIVALRGQTTRRATGLGWLAGFTMTMIGFYWLLEMLKTFSGFGTALCLVFMSILCGYQAGRIALLGWLYGRAANRGWPAEAVFALAFAVSELIYPLLFPWYYGATVHLAPALAQVADLGGPILVALVLVAANLAVAEVVIARLEKRAIRIRLVGALAVVPIVAALYGVVRIGQWDAKVAAAEKAKVGVVQGNMSLLGKRRDKRKGLMRHIKLTKELERTEGPLDLVVWSETSVAGARAEKTAFERYRQEFTRYLGIPVIFGAVMIRRVDDARRYVLFNSALISDREGTIRGRFDKVYLLAFGEYLPLGETFPVLYDWSPNSGKFTPGKRLDPVPLGDKKIALFICYEDIIPHFVNGITRRDKTHLLVNITNDAWFGDTTEPWIHLALAKYRSIEHRRFLVRSTNSGVSAVIDPVGRVVKHGGTFKEEAFAAEIAWLDESTVYETIGDVPYWIGAVVLGAGCFVRRKRPAPGKTDKSGKTDETAKADEADETDEAVPASSTEDETGDEDET